MEVSRSPPVHYCRGADGQWRRVVWRICVGLSLLPAFGTLYQRLTLPEAKRYEDAQRVALEQDPELKKTTQGVKVEEKASDNGSDHVEPTPQQINRPAPVTDKVQFVGESLRGSR